KRLRNIADNADRKTHNLYLNHKQATPNAEYVDYEDEEADCSSDISENRPISLPSTAVVGDRCGVSDQAVAAFASSFLHDVGLTTGNNSDLVVDEKKLPREKAKVRFQALSEAQALP
ncbi:hypothetical protein AVEN_196180-1, partial [Araneus ventricosus]